MGFDGDHFTIVLILPLEFQKHFYGFECVVGQVVMNEKDPCVSVLELFLSNFNFFKTFLFHIQREIECQDGQKVGRFFVF